MNSQFGSAFCNWAMLAFDTLVLLNSSLFRFWSLPSSLRPTSVIWMSCRTSMVSCVSLATPDAHIGYSGVIQVKLGELSKLCHFSEFCSGYFEKKPNRAWSPSPSLPG